MPEISIQVLVASLFQEVVGWADVLDVMQQICFSKQEDWPNPGHRWAI